MPATYRVIFLPSLPAGFAWSLPEANNVPVSRAIVHSTKTGHRLSIYFDTTCAAGAMYDGTCEPPKPLPYVECYDMPNSRSGPAWLSEPVRFLIPSEHLGFVKCVRRWCRIITKLPVVKARS